MSKRSLPGLYPVIIQGGAGLIRVNDIILFMNRDHFRALLRDALNNIHDYVELEQNPLNDLISRTDSNIRRVEYLKRFIIEGIESLKPKTNPAQNDALEWRYYRVLSGRYIEGASVAELQQRLALGERQERRLHGRACMALEEVLWFRLFPGRDSGTPRQGNDGTPLAEEVLSPVPEETLAEDLSFHISLEPLNLNTVIQETVTLFLPQLQALGGVLSVHVSASLPRVQADRIILRQILLQLFNHILQHRIDDDIAIHAHSNNKNVVLEILFSGKSSLIYFQDVLNSHKLLAYWLERLKAQLFFKSIDETGTYFEEPGTIQQNRYILELPLVNQTKIVVVDDHEPAIRIIQRYLSQTNIQIIGVTDPTQIISIARTLQPKAILLDIMMPAMDGWEILQKLKSDPETQPIPVIICSVWEQPELAFSLGANGFLKKPISQAKLLDELARSNLLDILDELPPIYS